MVNERLDLLTRARDRLIELDRHSEADDRQPWEVEYTSSETATVYGEDGTTVANGSGGFDPSTAELIVALRRSVPVLITRLDSAVKVAGDPWGLPREVDADLARAILGETGGTS